MPGYLHITAIQCGAALYVVLLFPASYSMPGYLAWENGLVEMLQNIVLLGNACIVASFFYNTLGQKVHYLWLAAIGYFLLLLGRELSWGRVFFPVGMDSHGPVFISMHAVPGYEIIHGVIGMYTAIVFFSLMFFMPWKLVLHCIPFPKFLFCLLVVAAVLVMCGDKGIIFHSYVDANMEELAELLAYILQGYFAWYYYACIKEVANPRNV